MTLFPNVLGSMQRAMQASALRHRVFADNVANVNTPGFLASEVSFEEQLAEALTPPQKDGLQGFRTHEKHLPIGPQRPVAAAVQAEVRTISGGAMRRDGNTVDIESEMSKLAANQLWYEMLVRSVSDEFSRLRTVIMEGRR